MEGIIKVKKHVHHIVIKTESSSMRVGYVADNVFRLTLSGETFAEEETSVVEKRFPYSASDIIETDEHISMNSDLYHVSITQKPFSLRITTHSGKVIMSTPEFRTIDVSNDIRFRVDYGDDERVYGLGQDPMAKLDHRDQERRIWQEWGGYRRSGNAGVPFYISSKGYGLLLNSSWASRFVIGKGIVGEKPPRDQHNAPAPWAWDSDSGEGSPCDISIILDGGALDVFFVLAPSIDGMLQLLNELSGFAPMLPQWAYGFLQSKFRYRNFEELLNIATQYRAKKIPCDALFVDFGWFEHIGDLTWSTHFSEADKHLAQLRAIGFHVLSAQHPFIHKQSIHYHEFREKGFLNNAPEGTFPTYDFTNPTARAAWWEQWEQIFRDGIAGYWNDMGELEVHSPGTVSAMGAREKTHNIYSTMWAKALYEGQRSCSNQRVINLMRTTYPGMQRYAGVMWSGDIAALWDVLRDQIVIGQGVALSGQNYWCTDVGGFFNSNEFDAELYIRWFEYGVFCPLLRTHGIRPDNEAWSYGQQAQRILKTYIELRYRLLPYIYSCAGMISRSGKPLMRAMCCDYGDDEIACSQHTQFMFGPALLVAPVYEKNARERRLYLPEGIWYDFWTDKKYEGSQFTTVAAPLGTIPVFVKAGSILPMAEVKQYVFETPADTLHIHSYEGASGLFELYEDDGISYEYEGGAFVKTLFACDEKGQAHILNIDGKKEMLPEDRIYEYHVHSGSSEESDYDIIVDHNLASDGEFTLSATLMNHRESPLELHAIFAHPIGWNIIQTPTIPQEVTQVTHMQWKLAPCADALPIIHKGHLTFSIKGREDIVKIVSWGNEYATRWSIAANFDNADRKGLDRVFGPEINADQPHYCCEKQSIVWKRSPEQEYNCLGYVAFPLPIITLTINEIFSNEKPYPYVAYAKCRVWSECERECYLDVSGDPSLKIFVNGEEVFRSESIVLQQIIPQTVTLGAGMNTILVKVAIYEEKPFSGREYGFSFRLVDDEGAILGDLFYAP